MRFHHQAYDPALELRDPGGTHPDLERAARLALRRADTERDVAINLLFGRSMVMPVGHVTDSPLFIDLFARFFAAYSPRKARIDANFAKENVLFRPFRVTLYPGLKRIRDVAAHYRWAPARFAMFNHLPIREQREAVVRLCAALAQGRFAEAGRIVGDPAMTERYAEIDEYFDVTTGVIPTQEPPSDYLSIVNAHADAVAKYDQDGASGLRETRDAVIARLAADPMVAALKLTGEEAARRHRGAWYYHGDMFGAAWAGVAASLDATLAFNTSVMHRAKAASFVAPLARTSLPKLAEQLADPRPTVDWDELLKHFEDVSLRRAIIGFQMKLDGATGSARDALFRDHAEAVLPYAAAIGIRSERLAAMLDRLNKRTRWLRSADPIARQLVTLAVPAAVDTVLPGTSIVAKIVMEPVKTYKKDRMADTIILNSEMVRREYRRLRLKLFGSNLRAMGPDPGATEFTLTELREHAAEARDADLIELASVALRGGRYEVGLLTADVGECLALPPDHH